MWSICFLFWYSYGGVLPWTFVLFFPPFFSFFLPEKLVWSKYFLESLQIKLTLTSSSFAFESQTIQNTECSMAFWVLLLLPCVLPLLLFSSELKNKRNWLNKMLIIYRIESHVDDQVSHVLLLDKLRVAE